MQVSRLIVTAVIGTSMVLPLGCDDNTKQPAADKASDHGHEHGPAGEHKTPQAAAPGHGGPVIALGSTTAESFNLTATRDQGTIEAGKDAPIDVTVTPASGATAKVTAVRFWIGTEDAKGSVKSKAEIENPAEPNRWHAHAEIPSPLPTDSKLWVEIEAEGASKAVAGFDLKR